MLCISMALHCGAVPMSKTFTQGIVRDSVTTQGLPFASVRFMPSGRSLLTDEKGLFEINMPVDTKELIVSCQGYATKTVPVKNSKIMLYDINLQPEAKELKEVVIKKQKYSKRNNPAVEFMKRLKTAGKEHDPRNNDYYSNDRYERITIGVNNFDTTAESGLMKRMPYLVEHVDSSEINGAPVLTFSMRETAATDYWHDGTKRTQVRGIRSNGIEEVAGKENVQVVMNDMLREVDLFDGDVTILRSTFVSPLSPLAADFYRFYLVDSTAVIPGSEKEHIDLAFYPRNKSSFGFMGHMYVEREDTSMAVRRVEMKAAKDLNINFINELYITQDFDVAPDGSRLKKDDKMLVVAQILPGTPQLYMSRMVNYDNHSFEKPEKADSIFSYIGQSMVDKEAATRDSAFWAETIKDQARINDADRVSRLITNLRQNKVYYWSEKVLAILFDGYVGLWPKGALFDAGPVNTFASYNALEGLRLRFGGISTTNLSKRVFLSGYGAYGFKDHRWKYMGQVEYSFLDKEKHPREFPVHSLRLMHKYDIDRLGAHYLYTSSDNFVLSLSRGNDKKFTYRRQSVLQYTLEMANHLSVNATFDFTRQEASPFVTFRTAGGETFNHFNQAIFDVSLRYAPGEKYFQTRSTRKGVNKDYPILTLQHQVSPKGFLGTKYNVNRTEFTIDAQIKMSMLGYLNVIGCAGHVWDTAPFTDLLTPDANLSYTIQPQSFSLMNPMEFFTTSYVSWFATWEMRGALFNLIPGLRKAGLREIINFKGIYGHLKDSSRPQNNPKLLEFPKDSGVLDLSKKPYMEISAGVDNILKILRVDYVWRLTYRNNMPYPVDKGGVRIHLHFTF